VVESLELTGTSGDHSKSRQYGGLTVPYVALIDFAMQHPFRHFFLTAFLGRRMGQCYFMAACETLWPGGEGNPATGRGGGSGSLSCQRERGPLKGFGAVPCSVSNGPLSPSRTRKPRLLTQLVAVLGHSRRCSSGDQINNVSSPIMPIPITSTANATGS
jgi:hypothetical protein